MKKFKRVLVITICGVWGGLLISGIISFFSGGFSKEDIFNAFITIIVFLLWGAVIGLSFGMGSKLLKDRGMMKKFKRVLVITICGALGGLLASGIIIFSSRYSKEDIFNTFITIIVYLLWGAIIGLSFGIGSELLKDRGMSVKTVVRTLMRGLFCLVVIILIPFGISFILEGIFLGAGGLMGAIIEIGFIISTGTHVLITMTLGISLGVEITRKMPYLLRGIGGIIGGIMLIPLTDYIFSYAYDKSSFQVYVAGGLIGLGIAIGSVISERIRVSEE